MTQRLASPSSHLQELPSVNEGGAGNGFSHDFCIYLHSEGVNLQPQLRCAQSVGDGNPPATAISLFPETVELFSLLKPGNSILSMQKRINTATKIKLPEFWLRFQFSEAYTISNCFIFLLLLTILQMPLISPHFVPLHPAPAIPKGLHHTVVCVWGRISYPLFGTAWMDFGNIMLSQIISQSEMISLLCGI